VRRRVLATASPGPPGHGRRRRCRGGSPTSADGRGTTVA